MIFSVSKGVSESTVAFVLIDTAIIIAVARLVGAAFKRIGQPPVIGEILAGLLLGPSLLGNDSITSVLGLKQSLTASIFPVEARPFLKVLAELGLVLFMFIVGLELDMRLIKGKERLAAGVSLTSVVLPFSLGVGLATILDSQDYRPKGADFLPFALFIGASMSVTAFPVLARVLTERRMHRTPIGVLALACAAIDDILAWSLLALVTAVVQASMDSGAGSNVTGDLLKVLLPSIAFVAFMFLAVKPLLSRLPARYRAAGGRLTPETLAVILGGVLVSSWFTSKIGIHSIFGAFLMGAVMPREGAAEFTQDLVERIESVAVLVLLPLFFIVTGLQADVGNIDPSGLGMLVLIVGVACAGKFAGATLAGRGLGLSLRRAAAVGTLMNTRGLTELVLLSIGLDKGVLSPKLFTLLVLMAIITTLMTSPLLNKIYPERMLNHDIAEAERASLGLVEAFRVLVLVDDPVAAGPLVDVACDVAVSEQPAEVVLSRLRLQPAPLEAGIGASTMQLVLMAEALEDLYVLRQQVEGRGLSSAVFSQFTDDVAAELADQAERQVANLVLVGDDRAAAHQTSLPVDLATRVGRDLAVVVTPVDGPAGPPPAATAIEAGAHPYSTAAFELGVRYAAGSGRPPQVYGVEVRGREERTLRDALRASGTEPADHLLSLGPLVDGDSGGVSPAVTFRPWDGTAASLESARADADRLGCMVALVRPDPNQLDRTSVDAFVTRRLEGAGR